MNDEDRKLLTEYMGECWHFRLFDPCGEYCKYCGSGKTDSRTFDTFRDFGDLKDKLVEKGDWQACENALYVIYEKTEGIRFSDLILNPAAFTRWLIDKDRFPQLAADWLRRRDEDQRHMPGLQEVENGEVRRTEADREMARNRGLVQGMEG